MIMHQQLQTMNLFLKPQFLKNIIQLLLSVSILFFSSSWIPYLSNFFFNLSIYTMDRNYMFLLCNGILVFVGLIGSSPITTDHQSEVSNTNGVHLVNYDVEKDSDHVLSVVYLENVVVQEDGEVGNKFTSIQEEEEEEEEEEEGIGLLSTKELDERFGEEKEEGIGLLSTKELDERFDDFEVEEEEGIGLLSTKELDERFDDFTDAVEEANDVLSTEELNKKFDDFIRKMKEKIRNEAQKQLIMI